MRKKLAARRDYIVGRLAKMPGVKCPFPGGAFYVFPDVSHYRGERSAMSRSRIPRHSTRRSCDTSRWPCCRGRAFGDDDRFMCLSHAASTEEDNRESRPRQGGAGQNLLSTGSCEAREALYSTPASDSQDGYALDGAASRQARHVQSRCCGFGLGYL